MLNILSKLAPIGSFFINLFRKKKDNTIKNPKGEIKNSKITQIKSSGSNVIDNKKGKIDGSTIIQE
ncbi:MAG: hypothetical protein LBM93_10665 [Oscillospiraceae bacterium]|jgi:hypothetical protein|nr:hypothetical protein [Oscillospiraceae bacterium]